MAIVNSAKASTTSRMVTIVSTTTMVIATLSIVVVLLPTGAEATIPIVGPMAQCIQGCTKSLATLTPGYCMTICGAEYRPLTRHVRKVVAHNQGHGHLNHGGGHHHIIGGHVHVHVHG